MPPTLSDLSEDIRLAARAVGDFGAGLFHPSVRLGVTGLSGAGKTVFITALVHQLLHGGRLPVFEALAGGRIARARLEPQPDDAVPRFDYETHVRALTEERRWPESTSRISELRLVIEYQSARGKNRSLTLDIVDYPGEWLLDLPLLTTSYAQWSADTLKLSRRGLQRRLLVFWCGRIQRREMPVPSRREHGARAGAGQLQRVGGPLRVARREQRQVEQPFSRIIHDVERERAVARAAPRRLVFDDETKLADAAGRVRPAPLLGQCVRVSLIVEPRHGIVGLRLEPGARDPSARQRLEHRQPPAVQ